MAVRGARRQRPAARVYEGRTRASGAERNLWELAYRLCCLLLMVGLAGVLWQLLSASAFRIERLEVKGNYLLSREEITRAAGVLGQNAFSVDRRRVAAAVADLGVLQKVDVGLALPNALTIRVVEYEPKYVWQVGQQSYLVDERGIVLSQIDAPPPLPGVKALDGKSQRRGGAVDLEALKTAARLKVLWPSRLGECPTLELAQAGLLLNGGDWRAELGNGANMEAKLLALAAIFDDLGPEDRPGSVDLRNPDRPYFK